MGFEEGCVGIADGFDVGIIEEGLPVGCTVGWLVGSQMGCFEGWEVG